MCCVDKGFRQVTENSIPARKGETVFGDFVNRFSALLGILRWRLSLERNSFFPTVFMQVVPHPPPLSLSKKREHNIKNAKTCI